MPSLAVLGAGVMGSNHGRIAATLHGVELTHVVDADIDRAKGLAAAHGAVALTDVEDIIGRVDAAVIALPTALHAPIAEHLLDAGIHCLVEKPIAGSLEDADRILAAARRSGATLMVGHVERFNPAVLELDNLLEDVVHIEASRMGPFSARVSDGIVLDLMVHDLDLVCSIARSEVETIYATSQHRRSESEDLACALLVFRNGITANLTASRLGQQKIRQLMITQAESFVTADLLRVDVTVNRVSHSEYVGDGGARYRQSGIVEIPMLEHRGEPLALELREFVDAFSAGRAPRVTGDDGRTALDLALRVTARAGGPG